MLQELSPAFVHGNPVLCSMISWMISLHVIYIITPIVN
jgi:hypothetical protein